MKKLTALVIVMMCVLALAGCNHGSQQVKKEANTKTLEVVENSVGEIGRETFKPSVEITDADANALSTIINRDTWTEELPVNESDCVINLKGHWIYYNSQTGILIEQMPVYSSQVQADKGKNFVLSEKDRVAVNSILEKYITLGFAKN